MMKMHYDTSEAWTGFRLPRRQTKALKLELLASHPVLRATTGVRLVITGPKGIS